MAGFRHGYFAGISSYAFNTDQVYRTQAIPQVVFKIVEIFFEHI
jgi:hypothetical protein